MASSENRKKAALSPLTISEYGLFRCAVAVPSVHLANPVANSASHLEILKKAGAEGCQLVVFPELGLSGYTCGDLFFQETLLDAVERALLELATKSANLPSAVVGFPLRWKGRILNCAALLARGKVVGIVPKSHLPNYQEFYEERWFTEGSMIHKEIIRLGDADIPLGTDLIFQSETHRFARIGIEICEDLWVPQPPSADLALGGATLIANPSASDELVGKADYRRALVQQQSARCLCAYLYASAGPGESSTDVVYSGHSIIAENGVLLKEERRFAFESDFAVCDIDVGHVELDRQKNTSFGGSKSLKSFRTLPFTHPDSPLAYSTDSLPQIKRAVAAEPFVPKDLRERSERCREILTIQSRGLARRMRHIGTENLVVGLSGGLDSTLAALVIAEALDLLKLPRKAGHAIVMPGLGSSDRTQDNACNLAKMLGFTLRTVPIHDAVQQHFKDLGHDPAKTDLVYENSQARERTQILMDIANQVNGIVVGTGDLSESALGWCTFNGDHMSMYHVNIGVPKTLVTYVIRFFAETKDNKDLRELLSDVVQTPISPELLPAGVNQEITQKTEESIGPYRLHDFFLYAVVRQGFGPQKILLLARMAFGSDYNETEIKKALRTFYQRFFSQQFKRSAMPDGPKVGTVALSPRGDWRMPSDAEVSLWLAELQ